MRYYPKKLQSISLGLGSASAFVGLSLFDISLIGCGFANPYSPEIPIKHAARNLGRDFSSSFSTAETISPINFSSRSLVSKYGSSASLDWRSKYSFTAQVTA